MGPKRSTRPSEKKLSNSKKNKEDFCSGCFNIRSDKSPIEGCGHEFCKSCLIKNVTCPICDGQQDIQVRYVVHEETSRGLTTTSSDEVNTDEQPTNVRKVGEVSDSILAGRLEVSRMSGSHNGYEHTKESRTKSSKGKKGQVSSSERSKREKSSKRNSSPRRSSRKSFSQKVKKSKSGRSKRNVDVSSDVSSEGSEDSESMPGVGDPLSERLICPSPISLRIMEKRSSRPPRKLFNINRSGSDDLSEEMDSQDVFETPKVTKNKGKNIVLASVYRSPPYMKRNQDSSSKCPPKTGMLIKSLNTNVSARRRTSEGRYAAPRSLERSSAGRRTSAPCESEPTVRGVGNSKIVVTGRADKEGWTPFALLRSPPKRGTTPSDTAEHRTSRNSKHRRSRTPMIPECVTPSSHESTLQRISETKSLCINESATPSVNRSASPRFSQNETLHIRQSETPRFGRSETPRFDRSETPRFGRSETPRFGRSETPRFDQSETPRFGRSETPRFGQSETPRFGQCETPRFGQCETPRFGQSETPRVRQCETPCVRQSETQCVRQSTTPGISQNTTESVSQNGTQCVSQSATTCITVSAIASISRNGVPSTSQSMTPCSNQSGSSFNGRTATSEGVPRAPRESFSPSHDQLKGFTEKEILASMRLFRDFEKHMVRIRKKKRKLLEMSEAVVQPKQVCVFYHHSSLLRETKKRSIDMGVQTIGTSTSDGSTSPLRVEPISRSETQTTETSNHTWHRPENLSQLSLGRSEANYSGQVNNAVSLPVPLPIESDQGAAAPQISNRVAVGFNSELIIPPVVSSENEIVIVSDDEDIVQPTPPRPERNQPLLVPPLRSLDLRRRDEMTPNFGEREDLQFVGQHSRLNANLGDVVTHSGLNPVQLAALKIFANLNGLNVEESMSTATSILVVSNPQSHTLKFLLAIVSRCRVVTMDWVEACIRTGNLLPLSEFIPPEEGPRRCVDPSVAPLFGGLFVCTEPSKGYLHFKELQVILCKGGANVVSKLDLFHSPTSLPPRIYIFDNKTYTPSLDDFESMKTSKVYPVELHWVFDCVLVFKRIPVNPYIYPDFLKYLPVAPRNDPPPNQEA